MLTKRFFFNSYNLLFIDSDSGGLFAYCFLGGAITSLIIGFKKNEELDVNAGFNLTENAVDKWVKK